jgi:hypothetical protein
MQTECSCVGGRHQRGNARSRGAESAGSGEWNEIDRFRALIAWRCRGDDIMEIHEPIKKDIADLRAPLMRWSKLSRPKEEAQPGRTD